MADNPPVGPPAVQSCGSFTGIVKGIAQFIQLIRDLVSVIAQLNALCAVKTLSKLFSILFYFTPWLNPFAGIISSGDEGNGDNDGSNATTGHAANSPDESQPLISGTGTDGVGDALEPNEDLLSKRASTLISSEAATPGEQQAQAYTRL